LLEIELMGVHRMEDSFDFNCDICCTNIVKGSKFTVESTEWESEIEGFGGGIDEENTCEECHDKIRNYIKTIRS